MMWILERNYPGNVLYVEGAQANTRITCSQVLPHIAEKPYQAVSSHLLSIPNSGEKIGNVHFSMLRKPINRVISAYRFHKKRGDIPEDLTIEQFVNTNPQAGNFQAKHSSMPDPSTGRADWKVDDRIYDKIESGEVFFGLVEYFDHSMLLLEEMARDHDFVFDGAYPNRINTTADIPGSKTIVSDELQALFDQKNAFDSKLYDFVKQKLMSAFHTRFTETDLKEFTLRCDKLRADRNASKVQVPGQHAWLHLDA